MKKVVLSIMIAAGSLMYKAADAQVGVSVGFNIGPVSVQIHKPIYDDFYYLPDVEAYYSVPEHVYYYMDGDDWVCNPYLPGAYRNYDWRNVPHYEVRAQRPYMNHNFYRSRFGGYGAGRMDWNRGRQEVYADRGQQRMEPRGQFPHSPYDSNNAGERGGHYNNQPNDRRGGGYYGQPNDRRHGGFPEPVTRDENRGGWNNQGRAGYGQPGNDNRNQQGGYNQPNNDNNNRGNYGQPDNGNRGEQGGYNGGQHGQWQGRGNNGDQQQGGYNRPDNGAQSGAGQPNGGRGGNQNYSQPSSNQNHGNWNRGGDQHFTNNQGDNRQRLPGRMMF